MDAEGTIQQAGDEAVEQESSSLPDYVQRWQSPVLLPVGRQQLRDIYPPPSPTSPVPRC